MGPEGFEPTPTWLKARDAAVTPQPYSWLGISVYIAGRSTSCCSLFVIGYFVIRHLLSGSPGNRTQRHPVISWVRATSPRLPCKSERSDSNRRSLGPKPSAIPNFATFCFQYPVRESNPHLQIESLLSLPLDQRAMLCFVVRAPEAQSGLGGARILVCGSSDRRYTVSATSPY